MNTNLENAVRLINAIRDTSVSIAPDSNPLAAHNGLITLTNMCHGLAVHSGWWGGNGKPDPRDNPMCFSNKLCLIHSEVSEAMEGDRKSLKDDKLPHRDMREVELADALVRILDLAGAYNMDIAGAVIEKLAFNQQRPDHKLENRLAEGGKSY